MINRFKSFIKKLNDDNKGMSIVTVIVAIGFVLILVSIMLSTSAINFKMRNMNVYSKDSFYSAEQVLDELNIGLQQMVQDGLSAAYVEVLTTYNDEELTSKDKDELVKGQFYNYILENLGVNGKDSKHYVAMGVDASGTPKGLYALLKDSTRWHEITADGDGNAVNSIESSYGAFLRGDDDPADKNKYYTLDDDEGKVYVGNMRMTNSDGIYLEDVNIFYRDVNGFVSTIKTDIHLIYPGFRFSNPDMPEISDYTLITDTALTYDGTQARNFVIEGNSFAYKVDTKYANITYGKEATEAELSKKDDNKPFINIVATDLNMQYGKLTLPKTSKLWVSDINLESSESHNFITTIAGETYVRDDLNLSGPSNQLIIRGTYIGYGNSINSSNDSSAILVNGKNTQIDLEFAERISLAGRAFTSLSNKTAKIRGGAVKSDGSELDKAASLDFYMGESISAKSNQLMYLIPSECIGVPKDDEGKALLAKPGISAGNPMSRATYEVISANPTKIEEVALNKPIARLGNAGNTLGEYLDSSKPVKRVFLRTSDGSDSLVYYYMNFKDEEAANLFFAKYYDLNKDTIDKYMDQYISILTMPSEATASVKISMAGNATRKESEDSDRVIAPYIRALNGEATTLTESFEKEYDAYLNSFDGYCTRLDPNLDDLLDAGYNVHGYKGLVDDKGNPTTDDKALFDNLVNKDNFMDILDGKSTKLFKAGDVTRAMLIHSANVTDMVSIDSINPKCNLIVADCGLKLSGLSGTFTGLILAKGEIELPPSGITFIADAKKVDECLNMMTEDGVYSVYEIFTDADELSFLTEGTSKTDASVKVQDLVEFSNWTKNVEVK